MNKLKEIRLSRKMTQQELACKSGISRASIIAIEKEQRKNVTTKTLIALSRALDLNTEKIFLI
ncbi:hypothetical protein AB840_14725 [Megasphaera cerevisiae DSM 20462]|uniref:HTH cro/C1-type domain-containing protein n=1 Tax=Megasphaera cerevisiae DSM 20462 TaxID=1122219 RepID=A0A0J6WRU3_9FIRM|nr:helix-turn-helix transcriptional regulator [Megasphaera cerevisiae]KMO85229.1 hypothetical protein AB840_14725 [Megasphaera cerevisiae DSM 20462]SKA25297.1 DNA-binding transcriptional regulator, XRE-family HTH domain [Megasphaera cerevisiae DSM 20462]